MSIKIGQLEEIVEGTEKQFLGYVKTLNLSLDIMLIPNKEYRSSENAPDYFIRGKTFNSDEIQIGSAWIKKVKKPNSLASEFLSITIDDPSMSAPLNVAAFLKEGKNWDIVFRRRLSTN